jgi:DNA-binding FrmR family transcriptional regulator
LNLTEQTKLIDRLSYVLGHVKGIASTLKAVRRKDLDKAKLIELLDIIAYNLEAAVNTLIEDAPEE